MTTSARAMNGRLRRRECMFARKGDVEPPYTYICANIFLRSLAIDWNHKIWHEHVEHLFCFCLFFFPSANHETSIRDREPNICAWTIDQAIRWHVVQLERLTCTEFCWSSRQRQSRILFNPERRWWLRNYFHKLLQHSSIDDSLVFW